MSGLRVFKTPVNVDGAVSVSKLSRAAIMQGALWFNVGGEAQREQSVAGKRGWTGTGVANAGV